MGWFWILYGDPTNWPRWLRRTSLITAPLFWPFYFGSMILLVVIVGLFLLIMWPFMKMLEQLEGIYDFWSRS